jgi:DcuC family C4-dicarboxylate transporter
LGKANLAMAIAPLVPLILLFLCSPPFGIISIPKHWLASQQELESIRGVVDFRTIGFAMLVGLLIVIVVTALFGERSSLRKIGYDFFHGAGYAYTEVISLIIVAKCFADSAATMGVGQALDFVANHLGVLFSLAAAVGTAAFAMLCGSGIASTQGLFPLFAQSAQQHNIDPFHLGSIVVLASAAGRTSSPVAAVALMSASLSGTDSWQLTRRVFLPLCAGLAASFIVQSLKG